MAMPFIIYAQEKNPTVESTLNIDKAGDYNDYIIKHWKKASMEFHRAADKFNQPIVKAAFLSELKTLKKTAKQSLDSINVLNVYKDNDAGLKLQTTELLKFYINCAGKVYPEIVEKITAPKPDYDALQAILDKQNNREKELNALFLEAQTNFAELYAIDLK